MGSSEGAAFTRLVIIAAAWALGEALVWLMGARGLSPIVPALLAAAAFFATSGSSRGRGDGSDVYWRGRRIDRDRWR